MTAQESVTVEGGHQLLDVVDANPLMGREVDEMAGRRLGPGAGTHRVVAGRRRGGLLEHRGEPGTEHDAIASGPDRLGAIGDP